jgi:hypothetical protein
LCMSIESEHQEPSEHRNNPTSSASNAFQPGRTWEAPLPPVMGALPFNGILRRTEPSGPCPAAVAVLGLYPALTRAKLFRHPEGDVFPVPVEVEAQTFVGSSSAKEIDSRYLAKLGLRRDQVFFFDLYPYFMANTAVNDKSHRSMADNVRLYQAATGEDLAVAPRPSPDAMIALCNQRDGIRARAEALLRECRPQLLLTLGNEAAAYVLGEKRAIAAQKRLYGKEWSSNSYGLRIVVAHLAHPGLLSRRKPNDTWNVRHEEWCNGPGKRLVESAVAKFRT